MVSPLSSVLEAENQALRAEIQQLRANKATLASQQATIDKYEQSQVRFRTVFDESPLGQKIIDADLVIRQANPAVVAMLGFTHTADLVGRRILEFTHADHRADWARLQENLWAHQTPFFKLETCLVRQDGSSFWCQVTSVLFQDEEGELGWGTLPWKTSRSAKNSPFPTSACPPRRKICSTSWPTTCKAQSITLKCWWTCCGATRPCSALPPPRPRRKCRCF